ncbi:FHA domain-containing protein [Streptomyces sp. NPDC001340]
MHCGNPPLFLTVEGITQRLGPARTYTVGRDPQSDVVFREAIVSWWHARIYWGGTSWVLQDLNSTNGTYDLGRRISLAEVGHGALLTLGDAADSTAAYAVGHEVRASVDCAVARAPGVRRQGAPAA